MSEWQAVEDYDPEIGSVIVCTDKGYVGEASLHENVNDSWNGWWWANTYGEYYASPLHIHSGNVTHWIPLPKPPVPTHNPEKEE